MSPHHDIQEVCSYTLSHVFFPPLTIEYESVSKIQVKTSHCPALQTQRLLVVYRVCSEE